MHRNLKPALQKVEGHPSLVRDTSSNAILATDLKAKKEFLDKQKRMKNLIDQNDKIEKLSKDIDDIKVCLNHIINKLNTITQ